MDSKKESVCVKNPTKFELQTLKDIAKNNNCTMEQLIDSLISNCVSEAISIQIHYNKTCELPE